MRRRRTKRKAMSSMQILSRTSRDGCLLALSRVLQVQRRRSAGWLELPFGVAFAFDLVQSEHVQGCARCSVFERACCCAVGLAASSGIRSGPAVFIVVRADVPASPVQFRHAWNS